MKTMDLNADLGEGGEHDAALMALASSVNIACGGHAGDERSIRLAVELAMQAQVAIGAHPGYEDTIHFGRKPMHLSPGEIRSLILRQLERMLRIHPQLHHVKPHGALYNQANENEAMAEALVAAIAGLQPDTILYCPPHGALAMAASAIGMATCAEGFIDRRYQDDGNLCPRSDHRALIEKTDEAVAQALRIAIHRTVTTLSGASIPLEAKTLCVHGDSPGAVEVLRLTRSSLERAGIGIMAPRISTHIP
jgi:5-oxoprolinase (ATP-hydrolysing) subunit A